MKSEPCPIKKPSQVKVLEPHQKDHKKMTSETKTSCQIHQSDTSEGFQKKLQKHPLILQKRDCLQEKKSDLKFNLVKHLKG